MFALFMLLAMLRGEARVPQGPEVMVIGTYIRSHLTGIEDCYARRLQFRPDLRGRLVLRFEIEGDGAVTDATAGGINDPQLIECVVGQVKAWRFDKPTSPLQVAYPINLQP